MRAGGNVSGRPEADSGSVPMNATVQNLSAICHQKEDPQFQLSVSSAECADMLQNMNTTTATAITHITLESTMTEARAAEELSNAKRNWMYRDLGLDPNLKGVLAGLGYNELKRLKKLHVLYAAQRARSRPPETVKKAS